MRALILADTHFHSFYGPWKSGDSVNGMKIQANYVQRQLWDAFESIKDEEKFDFCILNGDIVDGYQRAEQGKYVIDNDLANQCKYAAEKIAKIVPTDRFFVTQGTPYHVGNEICADEFISEILQGKYKKKCTYHNEQIIHADEVAIHASHNISISNAGYKASAIAKDVLMYEMNKDIFGDINLIVRSHAHYFVAVDLGAKAGLVTPCFQARTHYCTLKNIATAPSIGYVVLDIENENINVKKKFFKIDGMIPESYL